MGYRSNALEVYYALVGQLYVTRHNITVTKHSPNLFLVEFKLTPGEGSRHLQGVHRHWGLQLPDQSLALG